MFGRRFRIAGRLGVWTARRIGGMERLMENSGARLSLLTPRTVSLYAWQRPAPCEVRLPTEGDWSLHVVGAGALRVRAGESRVSLSRGDVLLLRHAGQGAADHAGAIAEWRAEAGAEVAVSGEAVQLFGAGFVDGSPCDRGASDAGCWHFPASVVAAERPLATLLELLGAELREPSAAGASAVPRLWEAVFGCVQSSRRGARIPEASVASLVRDEHVARALERMRRRPDQRWTVHGLAKVAGLSRAVFARRFVAALGIPPLRYLTELRLQLAAELLVESDETLASIAARVGYESEFAFSRAFKRQRGEAPGVFRRRLGPGRWGGSNVTLALAA